MFCKKILPFFLAIFLLCIAFNVNGQTITISPSSITVEMIGGDIIDVNITASQDSGYDLICDISYSISPDDIGINVSFSVGDTFLLCSGDDVVIVMTINTSYIIMPGTYIIDIYVNAEKETDDKKGNGGFSKSPSDSSDGDDIIPDDEVNETPDDVDETPDNTSLLDDELPSVFDYPSSWISRYYMSIIIIAMLITIVVTLLILYWIERRKKNEK